MQPKVSVIMPSLNVGPYIRECIDSVVNQSLKEIEIICVDAGSTDGTLEVLEEYAARDPRITIIHSEKKSYGYQMNVGIDAATGEYLGIVETDDYIELNMFETLYAVAKKKTLDLIKADYRQFTTKDSGNVEYRKITSDGLYNQVLDPKIEKRCVSFIITCCGIYKRTFIRENKIRYNETPGASYQDTGFCFLTHCCAQRIYFLNQAFYWYRRDNPNSSIHDPNKSLCVCNEYEFIYQFLNSRKDIYESFIDRYCREMYYAYMSTYNRVSEEYKLSFLKRMSSDFQRLVDRGEFFPEVWNKQTQNKIYLIIRAPEEFYFKDRSPLYFNGKSKDSASIAIGSSPPSRIAQLQMGRNLFDDIAAPNLKKCLKQELLIVSLTSYPARIHCVFRVIKSMKNQTVSADKIILWLAEEQFPAGMESLPAELLSAVDDQFEIRWCHDLKSHKKYYNAMLENPDSIIITIDDDLYYPNDMIEKLLRSYLKYPFAVSALRAHQIVFDQEGRIAPYAQWHYNNATVGFPSYALLATSGAGTLFPPHCMNRELFNIKAIKTLCLNADDMWLKVMQILNGTPVVIADIPPSQLLYIEGSQEEALWKSNMTEGKNDEQLARILEKYDSFLGDKDTVTQRIRLSSLPFKEGKLKYNTREMKQKPDTREADAIRASWSYQIGRAITFAPRKVRGIVHCYQDHGAGYTVRRTLYHIGLWEDEEAPKGPENRPKIVKHAERILHPKKGK